MIKISADFLFGLVVSCLVLSRLLLFGALTHSCSSQRCRACTWNRMHMCMSLIHTSCKRHGVTQSACHQNKSFRRKSRMCSWNFLHIYIGRTHLARTYILHVCMHAPRPLQHHIRLASKCLSRRTALKLAVVLEIDGTGYMLRLACDGGAA